ASAPFLVRDPIDAEVIRARARQRLEPTARPGPPHQRSKLRASCGIWLACANTETPACDSTWLRDILAVSSATSTSTMRELAAERFRRIVWMLLVATCRRFIALPKLEREVETSSIASSMVSSAESALSAFAPAMEAESSADRSRPPKLTVI